MYYSNTSNNNLKSPIKKIKSANLKTSSKLRFKKFISPRKLESKTNEQFINEHYSSEEISNNSQKKRSLHSRQENSLGELTKNFINYVKESGRPTININDLVKKLKVKKRRIYDITNVLEGIGYIKKHAKNEISWIKKEALCNHNSSSDFTDRLSQAGKVDSHNKYQQELDDLEAENQIIENNINQIKNEFNVISNNADFNEFGYVTFEDLNDLSSTEKIDLLAIKAPKGTFVDIINPKESRQAYLKAQKEMDIGKIERDEKLLDTLKKEHHLFLDSQKGEIIVYRITNDDYSPIHINSINNNNPEMGTQKYNFSFFGNPPNNLDNSAKNDK